MRSVGFTFNPDISLERQEKVLHEINNWVEISLAKRLKPNARKLDILRMAYAYVNEDANTIDVIKRLSGLSEIDPESISIPTDRRLI